MGRRSWRSPTGPPCRCRRRPATRKGWTASAGPSEGPSSIGPHRDDLEITLGGLSARSFGSQGQQRSCALALKLAECRLIGEITGEEPIVLLDDVLSELDQGRRDYVLSGLGKQQIFITCCDLEDFSRFRRAKVFGMEAGRLTLLKKPSAAGPGW